MSTAPAAVPDLALARVLLFAPSARPGRFAKTAATPADGFIIYLEDAVGPNRLTRADPSRPSYH